MAAFSKAFLLDKYRKDRKRRSSLELANFFGLAVVLVGAILVVGLLGQVKIYAQEIPTETKIRSSLENKGENSRIYDRNGALLYTFKDPDRDREYADYDKFSPTLIAAILAAEDKEFFTHDGIDFIATVKGLVTTVSSKGETTIGGSTLTQQLVKRTLLSSEQSFERKIKEAMLALLIERDYSKEDILEYYLNVVNLGGRIIGMETGAKTYFNKSISEVNLGEAIFLAALVQSPGDYSPLHAVDKAKAERLLQERRELVIDQLVINKKFLAYLNSGDREYLYLKPTAEVDPSAGISDPAFTVEKIKALAKEKFTFNVAKEELKAAHWVFYIRDLLKSEPYNLTLEDLYSGGYDIYTSLDLRIQEIAERKLKEGVDRYGPRYRFENGSIVTADARTGEILAMVGSKGYDLPSDPNNTKFDPKFNVATAPQSLGSSLKPFVVLMGFDSGKYNANSTVKDVPRKFYGNYKPKDADGKFLGEMSLSKALLLSRNIPFISMLYELGDWRLGELMEKIGYRSENNYGLSAAVGGVDESLLDHTVAYTGLANGGDVMKKRPVLKIVNRDGSLKYESQSEVIYRFNRKSVAEVNDILGDKSFTQDTYGNKFIGNLKLAGKTGTSDGNKDTYYMGYGPKIVTGVWNGNSDNSRMRPTAFGSTTSLLIWNSYMRELFRQFPEYADNGSF